MLSWIALGLTSVMYSLLIAFGLRNFFKYIVNHQQNQSKLLYVFAIGAATLRLGRYAAMIINQILGNEVHT